MDSDIMNILKNSTVLLVEDEQEIRKKFMRILSLYFSKIYEASNGQEGYDAFLNHKPTVIITDILMPVMDGLEFVSLVRESNETIPIIVTTAYVEESYLLQSIKLHLVDYLVKPIKHTDIVNVLTTAALKIKNPLFTKDYIIDENHIYSSLNKIITVNNTPVELTKNEVLFLELLILNRGQLVTKEEFEDKIYAYSEVQVSALKNLVFKLRKKLAGDLIQTVGKKGYILH